MKKKAFLGFSILIFVIAIAGVVYVLLLTPCENRYAISRPPIFSIGPYYLITDQGRLFPAQTYHYQTKGHGLGITHYLLLLLGALCLLLTTPKVILFINVLHAGQSTHESMVILGKLYLEAFPLSPQANNQS